MTKKEYTYPLDNINPICINIQFVEHYYYITFLWINQDVLSDLLRSAKILDTRFLPMPNLRYFYYSVPICISITNLAPSLKAYVKIAYSDKLMYSLQLSSNFLNISFCSSLIVWFNFSWCRAIYSISAFIFRELFRLSFWGSIQQIKERRI